MERERVGTEKMKGRDRLGDLGRGNRGSRRTEYG